MTGRSNLFMCLGAKEYDFLLLFFVVFTIITVVYLHKVNCQVMPIYFGQ